MTVRKILKDIRNGETFRDGFLSISYYNESKDTFLVDNLYNGTSTRDEMSAYRVRNIIKSRINR